MVSIFSCAVVRRTLVCLAFSILGLSALAQTKPVEKRVGRYAVTLRLPEAIYAEETTDLEFRLADTSSDDPVLGAAGVIRAKTSAKVTMPAMPGMPVQTPKIHAEGVPGDYGVETYFPHGGDYQIELELTPPGEISPIKAAFLVTVQDAEAAKNRKQKPKPFYLELLEKPAPKAGKPMPLHLAVRNTKTKETVKEFDVAHTQIFHLIIVSKDLGWFVHEHPVQQTDGSFTIEQIFPAAGEYRIFADVAPKGAGSQVLPVTIKVAGDAPPETTALLPTPSTTNVDGVKAVLRFADAPLPVGKSTTLTFVLSDAVTGKPLADLEPYLGARGHLILIHQDGLTFVHSHPMEDDTALAAAKNGTVSFNARFPKPGFYKAWGQFGRGGKVLTIPFVFRVNENPRQAVEPLRSLR